MSLWLDVILPVVQTLVGFLLGVAAGRWRWFWRLIAQRPDVQIHVEADPEIIYANAPNWITFPQFVPIPGSNLPPPRPGSALGMTAWAAALGGVPAYKQDLQVTLMAWADQDVVVDTLRVKATEHVLPTGVVAISPVGGADWETKRLRVDLSTFASTVTPIEAGGQEAEPFSFTLKAGERARFHLLVQPSRTMPESVDAYAWTATLDLLVGNKRRSVPVDNRGKPFILANRNRRPEMWWSGTEWKTQADFSAPS